MGLSIIKHDKPAKFFGYFPDDNSSNLKIPAEWATGSGLKASEKVYTAAHLTMYIRKSVL